MNNFRVFILSLLMCVMHVVFMPALNAQQPLKSQIITEYNGKQYYIHTVQKKQSLKEIAEVYGVSVGEIMMENKDIKNKPKAGSLIRIPYKEEEISEIISETEEETLIDSLEYQHEAVPISYDNERLYKVALMMPLYLENIDEEFLEEEPSNKLLLNKAFSYLHFYEGFMMAVDSMIGIHNMKIDLKVYDIDQDTLKLDNVINDEWLATADMIVGPFHLRTFEKMLSFAEEHDILIVNPMTNRDDMVEGKRNMVKVKPSYYFQMQWLETIIRNYFTDNNVFIVSMDDSNNDYVLMIEDIVSRNINEYSGVPNSKILKVVKKKQDAWKNEEIEFDENTYVSDNVTLDMSMIKTFPEDTTMLKNKVMIYNYSVDSLKQIERDASSIRDNLFIVYGDSKVFAMEMMNKLNILNKDYPINLIAMPDWSKYDQLFNENLMKLNTIIFDDDYMDYSDYAVGKFICKFREEYNTEPNELAYHGFNIAWYFLNALINYGDNIADGISDFDRPLLNTNYDFERRSEADGYENRYWNVYKYKDYEKKIVPCE